MSIDALGNSNIVLVNERSNCDIKDLLCKLNDIDNYKHEVAQTTPIDLIFKIWLCEMLTLDDLTSSLN